MRQELEEAVAALRQATNVLEKCTHSLSRFELLDGSTPLVRVDWRPRDEVPPKGGIWASDGEGVWLIKSDGKPIPDTATAVKFWTNALIPLPPSRQKILDSMAIEVDTEER